MLALLGLAWAGVTDVTAAEQLACALVDGRAVCWGELGPVGGSQGVMRVGPTEAGGPAGLVALETDGWHLLGIDGAGVLWRWQIGREAVRLADGVAQVVAGSSSLCLRTKAGEARCWFEGWDDQAPLGKPTWSHKGAVDVALSVWAWCALTTRGEAVCGPQPLSDEHTPRGVVARSSQAAGLVLNYSSGCLLQRDGPPICFGDQDPPFLDQPVVAAATGWSDDRWGWCWTDADGVTSCALDDAGIQRKFTVQGVQDVELGKDFACGIRDGAAWCWGEGAWTWMGEDATWRGPARVYGLDDAVELAVSREATCARRASGAVLCWGPALGGRVELPPAEGLIEGLDVPWLRTPEGLVPVGQDGPRVVAQDAAGHHEAPCSVRDGRLQAAEAWSCKGAEGSRASLVASDTRTVCYADGSAVRCVGEGERGTLGHGRIEEEGAGVVVGVGEVQGLAGRDATFCALTDGEVRCWGDFALAPYRLGLPEVVDVAVGGDGLTCAATTDGALWCRCTDPMPYLLEGYLGIGRLPAPVPGLTEVVDVGLGVEHGCVLHADGGVSCFGRPEGQRLGDRGTFRTEPWRVPVEQAGPLEGL